MMDYMYERIRSFCLLSGKFVPVHCSAWIVHQKLIDLSHRYTRDNTALDELAFRELLVSNILIGMFMLGVACFLYFAAVFSNPYLSGYWVHLVHYFQVVIYEVSHGVFHI